ncbi:unnamed protein product [Lathyrus oleraceus]
MEHNLAVGIKKLLQDKYKTCIVEPCYPRIQGYSY